MRVWLPNNSLMGVGGGWTFRRNLIKGSEGLFEVVMPSDGYDLALVSGATMVTRDTWQRLRDAPQPVVLRVDGIPEDWRNRGTGWPRLRDFAREADAVVYQSEFSRRSIGGLLWGSIRSEPAGPVIYNGFDTSVFRPDGVALPAIGDPAILHVNYRKDPNKRIEEVIYRFRMLKLAMPEAAITFLGAYPRDLIDYNFGMLDWERGRDWDYRGPVEDRQLLARIMRGCDWFAFPSFADPCPNTLIEAMACGLSPIWLNPVGGAREIADQWESIDWSLERMAREYLAVFEEVA